MIRCEAHGSFSEPNSSFSEPKRPFGENALAGGFQGGRFPVLRFVKLVLGFLRLRVTCSSTVLHLNFSMAHLYGTSPESAGGKARSVTSVTVQVDCTEVPLAEGRLGLVQARLGSG